MSILKKVDVFVYRYPLDNPVITSFGIMNNRPLLLLKVTDNNGIEGWGEIWCNFPLTGAEHRAKLVDNVFSPLLTNHVISSPKETFAFLTNKSAAL